MYLPLKFATKVCHLYSDQFWSKSWKNFTRILWSSNSFFLQNHSELNLTISLQIFLKNLILWCWWCLLGSILGIKNISMWDQYVRHTIIKVTNSTMGIRFSLCLISIFISVQLKKISLLYFSLCNVSKYCQICKKIYFEILVHRKSWLWGYFEEVWK